MVKHCVKSLSGLAVVFLAAGLMVGCAGQGPASTLPAFSPVNIDTATYTRSHNVMVVLDTSSSMSDYSKLTLATALVSRMNQTLPELGQQAGLRTFGHSKSMSSVLQYGVTPYNTADFDKGLAGITGTGGFTPMAKGLTEVATDLEGVTGRTALVIVSDGLQTAGDAIAATQALKDKFGSSLCIYPILVGGASSGEALMKKLADIGGCGFYSKGEDLLSGGAMANFVKKAFLIEKEVVPPSDSDNDGVIDDKDLCPDTPAGVVVDADGCPLDTDGDGVYDYLDKCPGTPVGAKVNAQGCWILGNLLFDFDKSDIKPEGAVELDSVATILEKNTAMTIILQGHTDSIGTAAYNQKLSIRRANAAKDYLVEKGIDSGRISCEGFGYTQPVATNETDFGRSLNRRVEIKPEM